MEVVAQFTNKLKINKPTVSFWRCKKSEASLREFVWIVTWVNYLRDSLLRTDSGYIPNNTHFSFLTRVMLGKSLNNIPFVLRCSFALLAKRSPLSVSAPKKNTRRIPRTHAIHIRVIQVEMWNEEKYALAIVLNCYSYRLSSFSFHEKGQATLRDDTDVPPVKYSHQNVVVNFEQNIQSESG